MARSLAQRSAIAAAALALMNYLTPVQAHADTPLEAFCQDNKTQLQTTNGEMGLDPATWASNPKNLARFGYGSNITGLYHSVIDQGAPSIKSYWSDMNGRIEWRCLGQ